MKITASRSIISWKIHGETMNAVTEFIYLGSKITADSDCSCGKTKQNNTTLGPWKKSYEKTWQNIKKHRHNYTRKDLCNQTYGFSRGHEWMWELDHKESWALKNWCFGTVCWTSLLRVPWTARRSNQSILKKSVLNIHWKDRCWSWTSIILANWWVELTNFKRPWW